jgi:hypothetical protein
MSDIIHHDSEKEHPPIEISEQGIEEYSGFLIADFSDEKYQNIKDAILQECNDVHWDNILSREERKNILRKIAGKPLVPAVPPVPEQLPAPPPMENREELMRRLKEDFIKNREIVENYNNHLDWKDITSDAKDFIESRDLALDDDNVVKRTEEWNRKDSAARKEYLKNLLKGDIDYYKDRENLTPEEAAELEAIINEVPAPESAAPAAPPAPEQQDIEGIYDLDEIANKEYQEFAQEYKELDVLLFDEFGMDPDSSESPSEKKWKELKSEDRKELLIRLIADRKESIKIRISRETDDIASLQKKLEKIKTELPQLEANAKEFEKKWFKSRKKPTPVELLAQKKQEIQQLEEEISKNQGDLDEFIRKSKSELEEYEKYHTESPSVIDDEPTSPEVGPVPAPPAPDSTDFEFDEALIAEDAKVEKWLDKDFNNLPESIQERLESDEFFGVSKIKIDHKKTREFDNGNIYATVAGIGTIGIPIKKLEHVPGANVEEKCKKYVSFMLARKAWNKTKDDLPERKKILLKIISGDDVVAVESVPAIEGAELGDAEKRRIIKTLLGHLREDNNISFDRVGPQAEKILFDFYKDIDGQTDERQVMEFWNRLTVESKKYQLKRVLEAMGGDSLDRMEVNYDRVNRALDEAEQEEREEMEKHRKDIREGFKQDLRPVIWTGEKMKTGAGATWNYGGKQTLKIGGYSLLGAAAIGFSAGFGLMDYLMGWAAGQNPTIADSFDPFNIFHREKK